MAATASVPPAQVGSAPPLEHQRRGRESGRVLVLNATFEPINVCTVRRAVVLLLKEKAEVLEHSEWQLHSARRMMSRPMVIGLVTYIPIPPDSNPAKITRRALVACDNMICQYCEG